MPTYQYHCRACGHDLEAVQRFQDAPLTECPRCHGRLRKIFSPVGIVFKGSGFYSTDAARANKGAATSPTSPSGAATSTESSTATPEAAAPAPKAEAAAAPTSSAGGS